jgi:DNA-binding transcriptional MerR regulator
MLRCSIRTIRFYEERGLLQAKARTGGQHRRYSASDIERLRGIVELRRAGFSLERVSTLLALKRQHPTGALAARSTSKLLELEITVIERRIADLKRSAEGLAQWRQALDVCSECRRNLQRSNVCATCSRIAGKSGENSPLISLWRHG